VLVIGASFIRREVAAALRARKIEVHVVVPKKRPTERVLGPEMGDFVRALHGEHGVVFHLEDTVVGIEGQRATLVFSKRASPIYTPGAISRAGPIHTPTRLSAWNVGWSHNVKDKPQRSTCPGSEQDSIRCRSSGASTTICRSIIRSRRAMG
jgi:NADPH-dependent 2,4-dienoyl-CoA reductase/sulfur reductase-like enzyme